jgi:ubiquinone/menaquinone biosynthesis C-methylase UbiE
MYESEYIRNYETEMTHWWFLGIRQIYERQLAKIVRGMERLEILDLGCGTGGNYELLAKLGEATNLDNSYKALTFCRERGLQNLVHGSCTELPFKRATFDLVTMLGLLEHVEEDSQAAEEAYRVCREEGHLLLLTSAYQFLWSSHDVANEHKRRYSARELFLKIEAAGFEVTWLTYVNFFLFPFILLFRLVERGVSMVYKREVKRDLSTPPGPINTFLTWLLGLESRFVTRWRLPFGVSLICVARKKRGS